jgi:hypothetical protein
VCISVPAEVVSIGFRLLAREGVAGVTFYSLSTAPQCPQYQKALSGLTPGMPLLSINDSDVSRMPEDKIVVMLSQLAGSTHSLRFGAAPVAAKLLSFTPVQAARRTRAMPVIETAFVNPAPVEAEEEESQTAHTVRFEETPAESGTNVCTSVCTALMKVAESGMDETEQSTQPVNAFYRPLPNSFEIQHRASPHRNEVEAAPGQEECAAECATEWDLTPQNSPPCTVDRQADGDGSGDEEDGAEWYYETPSAPTPRWNSTLRLATFSELLASPAPPQCNGSSPTLPQCNGSSPTLPQCNDASPTPPQCTDSSPTPRTPDLDRISV